jgi:hypothetical protein
MDGWMVKREVKVTKK